MIIISNDDKIIVSLKRKKLKKFCSYTYNNYQNINKKLRKISLCVCFMNESIIMSSSSSEEEEEKNTLFMIIMMILQYEKNFGNQKSTKRDMTFH